MMRSKKARVLTIDAKEALAGYLFLLPWLIGIGLFVAYPFVASLYMSFTKVRVTGQGLKLDWIGWENYTNAFIKDNQYAVILMNEFKQTAISIPIIIVFALGAALLLNLKFPGRMLFRTIFFLPVIFATGQVLLEIFGQGAGGLSLLDQYDIKGYLMYNLPASLSVPIIGVLDTFVLILWYSGVQVLIFIAGLQTIGRPVYEAAMIEGANRWETFWKITLPALAPFILLNLIYTIVDMFTFPFGRILQYINGNTLSGNYGYASALSWTYFAIILVFILAVGLFARKLSFNGTRRR